MKTLITGASGFVGSAVLRVLLKKGFQIRSLLRSSSNSKNLSGLNVEIVHGDLRDPASLDNALKGCDSLFHVAADYRLWAKNTNEIYQSNVDGTINIMRAAQRQKISKIIYTSSVATLGINRDETPADENTPVTFSDMIGDYKKSKFLAEEKVKKMIQEDSLPATIVNPSAPIGPRDIKPTPTGKIILDFLNREMPAYLDTGLNLIDVKDCAKGHILAEKKGVPGERYILGNQNMSLFDILVMLETITGLKAPSIKMPFWLALSAGWICEMVSNHITGKPPAVPLAGVKMAKYFMYFDSSKAVRKLGLPQNSVENALRQSVDWFKNNNYVTR